MADTIKTADKPKKKATRKKAAGKSPGKKAAKKATAKSAKSTKSAIKAKPDATATIAKSTHQSTPPVSTKNTDNTQTSQTAAEPNSAIAVEANRRPLNEQRYISVIGAKQHNLRNIDVKIPRDKLVVITGLSGSGKSSLAFDTIYAEGQRKYVESLSAYARQFLEQLAKPDVEHIEGLPPTVAIEQRGGSSSNPRSTVATTTEIYDYLRLLFARVGEPHCWICSRPISNQTVSQMVDTILDLPDQTKFMVLAPIVRGQKGQHTDLLKHVQREGFVRVRLNGEIVDLRDMGELNKNKKHTIEVVVDRLVLKDTIKVRLSDSLETALALASGLVKIFYQPQAATDSKLGAAARDTKAAQSTRLPDRPEPKAGDKFAGWAEQLFSATYACPEHPEANLEELSPRMFSFNSPYGACEACDGLGTILEFDPELIVPDQTVSLTGGAIDAWRHSGKRMNIYYNRMIRQFCRDYDVDPNMPYKDIPAAKCKILMYGDKDNGFEGALPNLSKRWRKTDSQFVKARLHGFLSEQPCDKCKGTRLKPTSTAVTICGKTIHDVTSVCITDAVKFFDKLVLDEERTQIAEMILREIRHRLKFLSDVGLGYISLGRKSSTLSGGEAQRIRLATQVGSGLVGVCYVLDEPTIGLHQRDNERLIGTLKHLRDIGNTVIVVEHDEDTIRIADQVIDIGPAAGRHGGRVMAQGTVEEICASPDSITGKYLSGTMEIKPPHHKRELSKRQLLEIKGCRENNLKNLDVAFPLGGMICVTGVSGSGKSTLVNLTLLPALKRRIYNSKDKPGEMDKLLGVGKIDKVIEIDQSPIGRTPRSNPATYTGVFDLIRQLFAKTREAKIRGYKPGRFSFNVKGGRCEACQGQGTKRIEMHFLPDVYVTCQECKGSRYNRETLEVKYKGKTISDVLNMRVEDAMGFFDAFPKIKQLLKALNDVGLSYVELGQSSITLSGGEAQRVKLASELGKTATGHTLYILDEPTTGLHFADIHNLLNVLNRLADMGNTIIVIEHNLDIIKCADWIIDLGPEGGEGGGKIVAQGTVEDIMQHPTSYTGSFLKSHLARH